eukprot:403359800
MQNLGDDEGEFISEFQAQENNSSQEFTQPRKLRKRGKDDKNHYDFAIKKQSSVLSTVSSSPPPPNLNDISEININQDVVNDPYQCFNQQTPTNFNNQEQIFKNNPYKTKTNPYMKKSNINTQQIQEKCVIPNFSINSLQNLSTLLIDVQQQEKDGQLQTQKYLQNSTLNLQNENYENFNKEHNVPTSSDLNSKTKQEIAIIQQQNNNDAFKIINPHKFIQQNNFIPVPPMNNSTAFQMQTNLLFQSSAQNANNIGMKRIQNPISFYPSGYGTMINFSEAPRLVKSRGFGSAVQRKRESSYLTEEQKFIIDQAGEEQGNSDRSIDNIINVSQEYLNRIVESNRQPDSESENPFNDDSPVSFQRNSNRQKQSSAIVNKKQPVQRLSFGAVKANHKLELQKSDKSSPFKISQVKLLKNQVNAQIIKANLDKIQQTETSRKQNTRTILTQQNEVQKRYSFGSLNGINIKHLSGNTLKIETDVKKEIQSVPRNFAKTPLSNLQEQIDTAKFRLMLQRSKSNSKNVPQRNLNAKPAILFNCNSQQSSRSRSSMSSGQSNNSSKTKNNKIMSVYNQTLSPNNGSRSRGRRIVQTQNRQTKSDQQTTSQQQNFGFTLQGSNLNLIGKIAINEQNSLPINLQNYNKNIVTQQIQLDELQLIPARSDRVKNALKQIIKTNQNHIESGILQNQLNDRNQIVNQCQNTKKDKASTTRFTSQWTLKQQHFKFSYGEYQSNNKKSKE